MEHSAARHLPPNPNAGLTYRPEKLRTIYLAGGSFWSLQAWISRLYGVAATECGYANGNNRKPTYEQVLYEPNDFVLCVRVDYDPERLPLAELLKQFFHVIDPVAQGHQGYDWGSQYRSGIYYTDSFDRPVIAEAFEQVRGQHEQRIATEFMELIDYYPAEDWHQHYLETHPDAYNPLDFSLLPSAYGEEAAPRRAISPDDLKERLTRQQYEVTQHGATEAPFANEYNDTEEAGIYVDIVTGAPLFSSDDKYDAGCGWPSFARPIGGDVVDYYEDMSFDRSRVEVRSREGNSHLGHLFGDGPEPEGGQRYCINSAALRFIPYEDMEAEGYGDWLAFVHPDKAYRSYEHEGPAAGSGEQPEVGEDGLPGEGRL